VSRTKEPKTILITGATGGIGSALAEQYAASKNSLILFGRYEQPLEQLAERCRGLGARVVTQLCDLRDHQRFMECLQVVCEQEQPELVIANAAVSNTADKDGESWEAIEEVIEVNVLATMATVQAVLPSMRRQGRGQIALISSLAAWHGLPITPSYSASKAAIKNYAEALRCRLGPEGINVNLVMPGFVASRMSRSVPGPKPFIRSAGQAATAIKRGLEANRPRISFPFPLNLGCWFLAILPPVFSGRLLRLLGYRG
jgi:short-subunit dehydrogenase